MTDKTEARRVAERVVAEFVDRLQAPNVFGDMVIDFERALIEYGNGGIEKCAVRMETWTLPKMVFPSGWEVTREDLAAGIRALKETSP